MKTEQEFSQDFGMSVYVECSDENFTVTDVYHVTNIAKDFIEIEVQYHSPRNVQYDGMVSRSGSHASKGIYFLPVSGFEGEVAERFEIGLQVDEEESDEIYNWDYVGCLCDKYNVSVFFKKRDERIVYHTEIEVENE
jgi:hypothetical protein